MKKKDKVPSIPITEDCLPRKQLIPEDLETLYSWTIGDALRAKKEWKKNKKIPPLPDSPSLEDLFEISESPSESPSSESSDVPLEYFINAQSLKGNAWWFSRIGDKTVILESIAICARWGFPLPEWLAREFLKAYDDVTDKKLKSWDDAFGQPHPKGKHKGDLKKEYKDGFEVFKRVKEIVKTEGWPIDEHLFKRVGEELGVGGKTITAKFYYFMKEIEDYLKENYKKNKKTI